MFTSTALHKLIQSQSWESVEDRIASHPGEVRKFAECEALRDPLKKSKGLPLHHAVAQNPPKEIVDSLIGSYDRAICVTESAYHRTVLHLACMNRAEPSVIDTVFRRYPPAIKTQDDLKRLPIHYAIANGCKVVTLKFLLNEFPQSAGVLDHRNWMPLHIACGMGAPLSVVKLVFNKNPSAILSLDEKGHSPLELAFRKDVPKRAVDPKVIRFLEDATKDELHMRGLPVDTVPQSINISPCPNGGSVMMDEDLSSAANTVTSASSSENSRKSKSVFRCLR